MNPTQDSGNAGGLKSGYSFKRLVKYRPESLDYFRRVEYDSGQVRDNYASDSFVRFLQDNAFPTPVFSYLSDGGYKPRTSGISTFAPKAYSLFVPQAKYSPELVVNGGFDNGTNWALTQPTSGSVTISGGVLRINSIDGSVCAAKQSGWKIIGKKYKIEFDIIGVYTGSVVIGNTATEYQIPTNASGHISTTIISLEQDLLFKRNGICDITIDNISVVEVLNSLDGSPIDPTQSTANSQPYISGNIAPNEKPCLKNNNGDSRYMTHPTISFSATDKWTVSAVVGWNGVSANTDRTTCFGSAETLLGLYGSAGFRFSSRAENNNSVAGNNYFTYNLPGKLQLLSFVYSSGAISIYRNNVLIEQITNNNPFSFNKFFQGYTTGITQGSIPSHLIFSTALTPNQISSLHAWYKANGYLGYDGSGIAGVKIGSSVVASSSFEAVCSSNGTLIADANAQATWQTGASGWAYHSSYVALGTIYGKVYNKAAKLVIIANPPSGWHVATEAENTALAILGANALKKDGSNYWTTATGTNSTGYTALGGASRNADGTWNTIKGTASFWCADSDKVLKLTDNSDVAQIVAAGANEGHYIRLVKD